VDQLLSGALLLACLPLLACLDLLVRGHTLNAHFGLAFRLVYNDLGFLTLVANGRLPFGLLKVDSGLLSVGTLYGSNRLCALDLHLGLFSFLYMDLRLRLIDLYF